MEKLEEQLAIILEKSLKIAEQTGDFVIEQAPLLLQEFYIWKTLTYFLGILLCLVISIVFHLIVKRIVTANQDDTFYYIFEVH